MEMEQTECFETSAYKIQTPGITQKKTYNMLSCLYFRTVLVVIFILFKPTHALFLHQARTHIDNKQPHTK